MAISAGAALAALVSIHVPPDVPAELSAAATRSCDTALGEGQCELEDGEPARARFRVDVSSPTPDLDTARIELRKDPRRPAIETRDVSFTPDDLPRERWASVGVLIAALVVARSREPEAVRPTPPAPAPPEPPPKKVHRTAPPSRPLRFDLRALAGKRTGTSSPEFGAELAGSVLPGGGPWFGSFSLLAARRIGNDPGLSWVSADFGAGFRAGAPSARWAAEFRLALAGEYWLFAATEPGRSEHDGRLRAGGLIGVDAFFSLHPRWILSLGFEGLFVEPPLRVDVAGRVAERVPEYGALVLFGVRLFP